MKLQIKKGSTSVSVYLFIQDSASSTGGGKTGIAYNTSSLVAYYVRPLAASAAITLATQTVTGAWSSGGFVEVDATNMPGLYRLDLPDAVLATGVNSVIVMLKGASGMAPVVMEVMLVAFDPQDSVRAGLTSLPNAAAGANGGLPTGNASGQVVISGTASSAITSSSFAAGAIDNAAIATDAIGSAELATTAVNEIRDAILSDSTAFAGASIAAIKAKTDNLPSDPADASDIAGAFSTVNTTLGTISGYIDTEVAAIKAKTDNLPAAPAAVGDIPTAIQNANALLKRDMSAVTGAASRSLLNAIRALRNRWGVSSGTYTVYAEDDTTPAWTAPVTTNASADPVIGIDPA